MSEPLGTRYDAKAVESRWYPWWLEKGFFHADEHAGGEAYTIVIPPPNITGHLHMGHALNGTLQDILARWKRMSGYNTLWLPGTDHASIATEAVVTRRLASEGINKRELGREKFIERVWEWRREYGDRIIMQLKRIGSSCDWERTRFTMDEGLNRAVLHVFKTLYDEGLIYRGNYLVNWCPALRTVLSDDEVEHRELKGSLTHIRYPIEGTNDHLVVATTRPETMLGDTAVAMNPGDERYQHLRGKRVMLPLMNRSIPIVEDHHVKMDFGSGLVKVTPAHDPNDYEIGRRHDLPQINILNLDGTLNANAGAYAGLDRFAARKKVVEDLKALDLIEKIEEHTHSVGHCYRSGDIVEPMLSKQWFVKMEPLVKEAIEVVEDGRVRFIPKNWENTYFHWMRNVRDWPISRQLWWGHRIPVWHCEACEETTCSIEGAPEKCGHCGSTKIRQDDDVLDTWFSSALWPFSTLGWPDKTKTLATYYPTNALLTAHEIIFFWVARMIVMGLKFMKDIPFRDVYIHPIVMDEQGRKMSKSLGNSIDPIDIIEEYGTDAMRMTLCAYAIAGRNINLSPKRIEGYRNFINKLWNATRLVAMNTEDLTPEQLAAPFEGELALEDRWIASAFERLVADSQRRLEQYAFDQYAEQIYHFVWGKYCDWYLELVKRRLYAGQKELFTPESAASRRNAQRMLVRILEGICRLLHPAVPFITEEIWQHLRSRFGPESLPGFRAPSLVVASWPCAGEWGAIDEARERRMERIQEAMIGAVRQIRGEHGIAPGEATDLIVVQPANSPAADALVPSEAEPYFRSLIPLNDVLFRAEAGDTGFSATGVVGDIQLIVPLSQQKLAEERKRLDKEIEQKRAGVSRSMAKLGNSEFIDRAPAAVVDAERERMGLAQKELEQLEERRRSLA